ncbi:hypothetical protein [Synechococcus sp. CBW1107]|uniref:hypothetical protein n=1 Tax=Synechococcus sp. CBW1107 TaxID=2789857 RepID=UPI002AD4BDD7|nr:hypothetical protein [Synechococcus sp. CBW1107]CAK6699184.1 hypothetical protein ICNINCKA_02589 [Synechococcus sp. CBW1107]
MRIRSHRWPLVPALRVRVGTEAITVRLAGGRSVRLEIKDTDVNIGLTTVEDSQTLVDRRLLERPIAWPAERGIGKRTPRD